MAASWDSCVVPGDRDKKVSKQLNSRDEKQGLSENNELLEVPGCRRTIAPGQVVRRHSREVSRRQWTSAGKHRRWPSSTADKPPSTNCKQFLPELKTGTQPHTQDIFIFLWSVSTNDSIADTTHSTTQTKCINIITLSSYYICLLAHPADTEQYPQPKDDEFNGTNKTDQTKKTC